MSFAEFSRKSFLTKHLRWLLLNQVRQQLLVSFGIDGLRTLFSCYVLTTHKSFFSFWTLLVMLMSADQLKLDNFTYVFYLIFPKQSNLVCYLECYLQFLWINSFNIQGRRSSWRIQIRFGCFILMMAFSSYLANSSCLNGR